MKIVVPFESGAVEAELPDGTEILRMRGGKALADPASAIREALVRPIGSAPLAVIARGKKAARTGATACVVVSDKTRPVPYRGASGILGPILELLGKEGYRPSEILILVATGMHTPMARPDLEAMLGTEAFGLGIRIECHDAADASSLVDVGTTARGTKALIDRRYVEADLRILTGLVESHFMAGASGGRKSICPGLLGEAGTFVLHGPALMSDPRSRDLVLEGNPVHEEALAVARLAGADFIVNATVNSSFAPTGFFCGNLEAAHRAAVSRLEEEVGIPIERPYDLLVTHGGFVARNHYQAAKAAVAALGALPAAGGSLVMAADNRDSEPIGSDGYRATLALLKKIGPEAFNRVLASPDWEFIVDQWEAQMWARVLYRVRPSDFVYFAPQLDPGDRRILPGTDGRNLIGGDPRRDGTDVPAFLRAAVSRFLARRGFAESDVASGRLRVAFLADGPYGIPIGHPVQAVVQE